MKTEINLNDFPEIASKRLFTQISDDPNTGFIRILVSKRVNIMDDIKQIELIADTIYINPNTMKIVPNMNPITLSIEKPWIITNNYNVIVRNAQGMPVENPEFDEEEGESETNQKYLTKPAYDRFAEFLYSESNPISLPVLWKLSVAIDDSMGYFNIEEL